MGKSDNSLSAAPIQKKSDHYIFFVGRSSDGDPIKHSLRLIGPADKLLSAALSHRSYKNSDHYKKKY
jgi:dsRNA-specific ribonuclease